jgi:pimeloyl-ACP methyl ester carboxylesterase
MKRAYVDVPEGQVHYRTEGRGKAIFLLHMAGSSSDEYRRVIPFLSKSYRVIAIDYLGFGGSDPAPRKYSVEDHARTVLSVMDALGIKSANVLGNHTGAEVALEIAVSSPERMDNLILSSIPFFRSEKERIAYMSKPFNDYVEIQPDGSHLMEWWQRAARYGDPKEIVDERALDFHRAGARGEELHEAAFTYAAKVPEKLPLIKSPTLLIAAEKDHWTSIAPEVKKLIPDCKFTPIPNGPVNIGRMMPREFAEAILGFLGN